MEKTKFIRVAVEERLPQSSGNYWINDVVGEMKSSYFNSTLKSFPAYDFVEFWIDAVPDREDEMMQMLEKVTSAFYGEELELYQFNRIEEAKKLIQSVKSKRLK